MGCWNGTCGISNLPIKSGEKIALFVIERNKYAETNSGGFCYATDQYSPVTIPILGEYNDYGGIENISSNEKLIFDHLLSFGFSTDEKEKDRQNLDGKPKNLEELLNDYIERGVYQGIGTMMIREEIYNEIINFNDKLKTKYVFSAREFIKLYNDKIQEINLIEDERERKSEKRYFQAFGMMELRDNRFIRILDTHEGNWRTFRDLINESTDINLVNGVIDLKLIEIGLSNLRKFWTIQSGAGSQNDEVGLHKLIALKTLETIIHEEAVHKFNNINWTDELETEFNEMNYTEEGYIEKLKEDTICKLIELKKII